MTNIVYGFHSISPVVWQHPEKIALIYYDQKRQDKRVIELIGQAQEHGIQTEAVNGVKLDKLCNTTKHQGIIAVLNDSLCKKALSLKSLLNELESKDKAILMVLDGITDPHNLGAIIRSCDCFGVDGVIIPKDNSANINATVAKVSAGAINHIPVIVVNNLARTLEEIKEYGFWIAGTTLTESSTSLFEFKPDKKMVWVMGSEGEGIRRLVAENCDYLVNIPLYGNTQSLNVSVATGIVLAYTKFCYMSK